MKEYAKILRNGANQSTIKHSNRGLIFEVLNTVGPCSRTQLAKITGLTKTSITNITTQMIEEKIICEMGAADSQLGRKPVMLDISSHSPCALGVSINRDFVYASLVNLRGELKIEKNYIIRDGETKESLWKGIVKCCDSILQSDAARNVQLLGIGVASIGPLDIKNGMILSPPNFKGIHNIEIVPRLEQKYGLPVFMNNDMSAGAISEKLFGYGKRISDFVFIGVTNGIGAGVVVDKKFFMGSNGFAGEIGHISIDYNGRDCPCGNKGCLEVYAGIPYIEKSAVEKVNAGEVSLLSGLKEIRWLDIVDAAHKRDKVACRVIGELVEYLAVGITSIVDAYDPQVVFLGHDIAIAGDLVCKPLKESVNKRKFSKSFNEVDIKISKFKDMLYKINGAAVIIYHYLNGALVDYDRKEAGV
ncbi:ROK family transcriptional regulator [Christensenellaceae bacterium OttesenSCG-928-K19]|nr:ROK family transcriptional regulator [Christensenellaceae bacterium OttesenSCG-928-K19]